ncbi:MAG: hypothetical protein LBR41_02720 [Rickettsiales bacterium]|jgi:hypothetical protein|nr:hypothetical protein [Rickettsiales bacterium]
MAQMIFKHKKAHVFSIWKLAAVLIAVGIPADAAQQYAPGPIVSHETVYVDTPAQSYYAYPDDANFVPAEQFMQRADFIDYDANIENARAAESAANSGVSFGTRPAVICRYHGCTRLNDRITRAFLFNSLANTFMTNAHSRLSVCEADPFTRSCLASGISFPARIGVANALLKITRATIDQVSLSPGMSRAGVGMTFEILTNGVPVGCDSTMADIIVPVDYQATLSTGEFSCAMTADGATNVSLLINIDYIDLDYGILGGYYSVGLQGESGGGGTGYALFKTSVSNMGKRYVPATGNTNDRGEKVIGPGEYAVEPVVR